MDAYNPTAWAPAFTAIAGSSAALTGLLFVAISINLSQILKIPGLVSRAMEVLILLTGVLVLATLLLEPGMAAGTIGAEVLTVAVLAEVLVDVILVRAARRLVGVGPVGFAMRAAGEQLGIVLLAIGGVSLLAGSGGGLYWVVPAMVATMISAIVGAWVLLVEILR